MLRDLLTTPLLPKDFTALVDPLWSSTLRARVVEVRPETADATTLVLKPGRSWRGHVAGQHVTLGVDVDGVRHTRTYSLTAPPRPDGRISVTVKAIPDGTVSGELVRRTKVGTVVSLGQADGDFVLPRTVPDKLLMVSAGSGVTPVMGMLRQLRASTSRPDVVLVHSAPTSDDVIFAGELRWLADAGLITLHEQHTDAMGMLPVAALATVCPDWSEREAWVCGPGVLLDEAVAHWSANDVLHRLHVERFRAATVAVPDGLVGGDVTFGATGPVVAVDAATTLLDAGEKAGVILPSGCRSGICHTCVLPLLSGTVRDVRDGALTTASGPGSTVQTCISAPCGPVELGA